MGFLFRVAGRHTCNAACGGEENYAVVHTIQGTSSHTQSNCFTMLVHKADKPPLFERRTYTSNSQLVRWTQMVRTASCNADGLLLFRRPAAVDLGLLASCLALFRALLGG
jgi:hypothetical protein